MIKKIIFFLGLLLMRLSFASTIPEYQIQTIDKGKITFLNGAEFQTDKKSLFLVSFWETGDFIEIRYDRGFNSFPRIVNGQVQTNPALIFKKGEDLIPFSLTKPATTSTPDTFAITSIDFDNKELSLDNGSIWSFKKYNEVFLEWEIGDLIMIGRNKDPLVSFDAIIFNTDKSNLVFAEEQ